MAIANKYRPSAGFRDPKPEPPNLGLFPLPHGTPTCLQGGVFLVSGVLDSISRDKTQELIEKHGGFSFPFFSHALLILYVAYIEAKW